MPTKSHIPDPKSKQRFHFKVFRGGGNSKTTIRQTGSSPSPTMPAGRYTVACEAARKVSKWGRAFIEFSFRVIAGDYFGTALPGWIPIHITGEEPDLVVMPCPYTEACARVLGDTGPGDDLHWDSVFVGKILEVEARFRTTDARSRANQDGNSRKDDKDFLRVSSILGLGAL